MIDSLKVGRKITESKYLNQENSFRYRNILRIAFYKYEKMKYWLDQNEIYEEIKKLEDFENYTIENLKQDLDMLVEFKNFTAMQDTKKTRTIEEFKNRKFKYQITPITIELERTLIKLENIQEGTRGSLDLSLIERFNATLKKIYNIKNINEKEIFSWWNQLNRDFKYLNESYQDYISKFYSPKTEELLKTTEFLAYKEGFIKYLKEFITGIQNHVGQIAETLQSKEIDEETIEFIIESIVRYEKINIAIDKNYDEIEAYDIHKGRFESIVSWFLGERGETSMAEQLLETTNEIIRKITRYALQIIEARELGASRKNEYKKVIDLFFKCDDIEEAHKLSSLVFGAISSRHITTLSEKTTELACSIYDEEPEFVNIQPSNRQGREKTASKITVKDRSKERQEKAIELITRRKKEKEIMIRKIVDNKLIFKNIVDINPNERRVYLTWLSKAMNSKTEWTKNEYGMEYKLKDRNPSEKINLRCNDGDFLMPAYELIFKEKN